MTMLFHFWRPRLTAVCLAALMLAPAGCGLKRGGSARIFVPDLETAREQYWFAVHAKQERMIPPKDPEMRRRRVEEIRAAFMKVADRFPDDTAHTPLAKLEVVELHLGYDQPLEALRLSDALLLDTARYLEAGIKELEYVDLKARWNRAAALEDLGRHAEAQAAYKDCMDRYGDTEDSRLKLIVTWARSRYERVIPLSQP